MNEKPWIVRIMENQFRNVCWEQSDDWAEECYVLTHKTDDYPFSTIYLDQHGTYTVYEVVNDIHVGIAIEDEKLIKEKCSAQQAVNAAKGIQIRWYGWKDYPRVVDPSENVGPRGSFAKPVPVPVMDYETIFDGDD